MGFYDRVAFKGQKNSKRVWGLGCRKAQNFRFRGLEGLKTKDCSG